jgi:phenylpyruvate tautomerase PptA (4-oxalocrotonate tautomerase family)
MAQCKIYGLREALAPNRDRVSDAIHACAVEALGLPVEKRFHRFFLMEPEDFRFPPDRSNRYLILEISMFEGRSEAMKKRLIRLLFERLERDAGIPPQDLEITIFETPRSNWGIRGLPGDELLLNYKVSAD